MGAFEPHTHSYHLDILKIGSNVRFSFLCAARNRKLPPKGQKHKLYYANSLKYQAWTCLCQNRMAYSWLCTLIQVKVWVNSLRNSKTFPTSSIGLLYIIFTRFPAQGPLEKEQERLRSVQAPLRKLWKECLFILNALSGPSELFLPFGYWAVQSEAHSHPQMEMT